MPAMSTAPRPKKPRGPAKGFDPDEALVAAMLVFWRHGYEGASMADLTQAMGIEKMSSYRAFGNKQELFRRTVERFAAFGAQSFHAALEADTARAFARAFLRSVIEL